MERRWTAEESKNGKKSDEENSKGEWKVWNEIKRWEWVERMGGWRRYSFNIFTTTSCISEFCQQHKRTILMRELLEMYTKCCTASAISHSPSSCLIMIACLWVALMSMEGKLLGTKLCAQHSSFHFDFEKYARSNRVRLRIFHVYSMRCKSGVFLQIFVF